MKLMAPLNMKNQGYAFHAVVRGNVGHTNAMRVGGKPSKDIQPLLGTPLNGYTNLTVPRVIKPIEI